MFCWLRNNFQTHCSSVLGMKKTNQPINGTIISTYGGGAGGGRKYALPIQFIISQTHLYNALP